MVYRLIVFPSRNTHGGRYKTAYTLRADVQIPSIMCSYHTQKSETGVPSMSPRQWTLPCEWRVHFHGLGVGLVQLPRFLLMGRKKLHQFLLLRMLPRVLITNVQAPARGLCVRDAEPVRASEDIRVEPVDFIGCPAVGRLVKRERLLQREAQADCVPGAWGRTFVLDGGRARLPARDVCAFSEPSSSVDGRFPRDDPMTSRNKHGVPLSGLMGELGTLGGPGCFSGDGDSEDGTRCVGNGGGMFAIEGARPSLTRMCVEVVDSVEVRVRLCGRVVGGGVVGGLQCPPSNPFG